MQNEREKNTFDLFLNTFFDVSRDAFEGHDRNSTRSFCYLGLLSVNDIHDNATLLVNSERALDRHTQNKIKEILKTKLIHFCSVFNFYIFNFFVIIVP